ncbi:MAG: 4-hydroxythreonine-4-phosphate dehydrogenase PdxA [Dehalococcoidia bacterium]
MTQRPLLAVTMGDAAGIGPEIVAKALADSGVFSLCRPMVIGVAWAIEEAVRLTGGSAGVRPVARPDEAQGDAGTIDVLDLHNLRRDEVATGQLSAACGRAAVGYIEEAARLALDGAVAGIVTCPINKEAIQLGGAPHEEIGHQEILARMAGSSLTATMLITRGLRVAHLSTHKSLIDAARYVTRETVLARLRLTAQSLEQWGVPRPRIAVAALNPHGGEGGLLGREEIDEIAPAVEAARHEGIDARGPFPADSVFYRAIDGEFDAVLAMYHDQGHIAIKVHDFEDSVTVTMGVPFVRTSVDHGTAFDIAGKGIANHRSLVRAIETAVDLATGTLAPAGQQR